MSQITKISKKNRNIPYAFGSYVLALILYEMQLYYNCLLNEQGRKEINKANKAVTCQLGVLGLRQNFCSPAKSLHNYRITLFKLPISGLSSSHCYSNTVSDEQVCNMLNHYKFLKQSLQGKSLSLRKKISSSNEWTGQKLIFTNNLTKIVWPCDAN